MERARVEAKRDDTLKSISEAMAFVRRRLSRDDADHAFRMFAQAVGRWGVTDADLATAILLHETIEEGVSFDEIAERFGERTASTVATMTRDRRLPLEAREKAFADAMRHAPAEIKFVMLLDISDGLARAQTREWLAWKVEETRALCAGLPATYQPLVAQVAALFTLHGRLHDLRQPQP